MAARPPGCGRCAFGTTSPRMPTGSTPIEWGDTRVICGVTAEDIVPPWMKEQGVSSGWITAEAPPSIQRVQIRQTLRHRFPIRSGGFEEGPELRQCFGQSMGQWRLEHIFHF